MEDLIDFDVWLANFKQSPPKYRVTYNPETGTILGLGPDHAVKDGELSVPVDSDLAEQIFAGELQLHTCHVDLKEHKFVVSEEKQVFTVDEFLHRIPDKKYSVIEDVDCYITYVAKKKTIKIQLSKSLGGTKSNKQNKKIKNNWIEHDLVLFLTDYNDPNIFYEIIKTPIKELIGNTVVVPNITVPERFSIFTRRIFKNYVVEYK